MLFKNQKGDTILEVLIAVTVLSLILVATFTLANRNIQSTRQAAERGEAYKVAQSELEKLKLYMSDPGTDLPAEDSYFCMEPDASGVIELSGVAPADPFSDTGFNSTIYGDAATKGCKEGPNNIFYKITYRGSGADTYTFTSYIRWPSVTGNGVDQSSIVHRLYPDSASAFSLTAGSPTIPTSPSPSSPPPTPPTPSPTPSPPSSPSPITLRGSDGNCTPLETYNCETQGTSIFNCQNYRADYTVSPVSGSGYTSLFLDYSDEQTRCSGAPAPPSSLYSYNIDIYIGNQLVLNNYQLNPSGGRVTIPLGRTVSNVASIGISWDNNRWVSDGSNSLAYDPDLKITSIGLR